MKISSNNVKNNNLDIDFGNNSPKYVVNDICCRSFQISWSDLPANTKSLALVFEDYDAIPVCGFSWIHWVAANINPEWNELVENASLDWKDKFVQGKNSWSSKLINPLLDVSGFGGCAPPDKDHEYIVKVYALDTTLDIKNGFYLNEMYHKMENHVLDSATLKFWYPKLK